MLAVTVTNKRIEMPDAMAAVYKRMAYVLEYLRGDMNRVHFKSPTSEPGRKPAQLHPRTGALRNRITRKVSIEAGGVVGRLIFGAPYAATHEYGAIIRPVKRKWLGIPLPAAKTKAGVFRHSTIRRAFDEEDLFVPNWRKKHPVALRDKGDGTYEPYIYFSKQVKIPARPFVAPTLERNIQKIKDILLKEIANAR